MTDVPRTLPALTIALLQEEARNFAIEESTHREPTLYGVDNGKRIGSYLDFKFQDRLASRYEHTPGNAAAGIDLIALEVDIKTTSIAKPQSSCPYRSMRQKVYGLGYSLLIFVYEKADDPVSRTSTLRIVHTIFIDRATTADFQLTQGLLRILDNNGNADDLSAFIMDRTPFISEVEADAIAAEVLTSRPLQGVLTISNAWQWRLAFGHALTLADTMDGVIRIA